MATDSLVYSLIQIIHNLNATVVVGAPLFGWWYGLNRVAPKQVLGLTAIAWALQGITGAAFGVASYSLYGALPDLHPIGMGALVTKVGCACIGLGLCLWFLLRYPSTREKLSWGVLTILGVIAVSAAAVLRWNT